MLHSMTGFGEGQYEDDKISLLVEIKALNNRFLKTNIKLPDALSFAEPEVERLIREQLCRGSISYVLHMRNLADAGPYEINRAAVRNYLQDLESITSGEGRDDIQIDLASILQLPGVCQPRKYSEEEHRFFLEIIEKLTGAALQSLRKMREEEGKGIVADLKKNCQAILDNIESMSALTDNVVEQFRKRIEKRANEMLSEANLQIDEDMLAKEVALFAERSDINEELSRLRSHLGQFLETCDAGEQIGRRLDFLTQELLREANTIGSKANNARISHHVVEIKVAIDRLKEQVQNVE